MPVQTDAGIRRFFTSPDVDPLDAIEWERRDAWPEGDQYHRPGLEVPKSWSDSTLQIVSKLYLARGGYSEDSVRTLIERVSDKIVEQGVIAGYFGEWPGEPAFDPDHEDEYPSGAVPFLDELQYILVNQFAAFNSPVWFNIGRPDRQQVCSACYLLGVEDESDAIMKWANDEKSIFKAGAGSGANLSKLRGSMEPLSTGGVASGPVSFMRIADATAGTFKSGGTTRRAAKLVALDDDHPDIRDFITVKAREEERLRLLLENGYDISLSAEGERTVADCTSFQNANNSVRVSDAFMRQVENGDHRSWPLVARKSGEVIVLDDAVDLFDEMAKSAWDCADPGVQFHDTINSWDTTPNDGPIRTTNPCGETHLSDDASCNLASINILKFVSDDGAFDVEGYRQTIDVMITAMDILVEFCEQPTERLTRRTKEFRWLGLGYANMGAALMAQGLAYDSDEGRDFAAAVTALMTGRAYTQSAQLAEQMGPFAGFTANADSMLRVMSRHAENLNAGDKKGELWDAATTDWLTANELGEQHGYRNAQATVIAPTGSISFMMGCDTTGIEPAFSLVTHKQLAGGGSMRMVNGSVIRGLRRVIDKGRANYLEQNGDAQLEDLAGHLLTQLDDGEESFLCALDDRALDCSPFVSANEISAEGHVKMIAAIQPFLSGAPSKTINMPEETTWEQIRDINMLAWKLGVKCIAIYRNNSKARQVLSTKPKKLPKTLTEASIPRAATPHAEDQYEGPVGPERKRMPRERQSITHKWNVGGHEGYMICGEYEDGSLGEVFLEDIGKEGSHVRGMANAWAIAVSIGLQYGVPLEVLVRKYTNMNFEPNGPTENPLIPFARSVPDYLSRYLASRYLPELHDELGIMTEDVKRKRVAALDAGEALAAAVSFGPGGEVQIDSASLTTAVTERLGMVNGNGRVTSSQPVSVPAREMVGPPCSCGGIMQRAGSCWACSACGETTGCG